MEQIEDPDHITKAQLLSQASHESHGYQNDCPGVDTSATRLDSSNISNSKRQRVSWDQVEQVRKLIEQCLYQYFDRQETIKSLLRQAGIEPVFTTIIWQRLEEENPAFFKVFYTILAVKRQIILYNQLLSQQSFLIKTRGQTNLPLASLKNDIYSKPLLPNGIVGNLWQKYPVMQGIAGPNSFCQQLQMPAMIELNASLQQRPVPATAQLNPFIQQPLVPATAQLNPFLQHPPVLAMAEPYPIFQHPPMPSMPEPHPFLQHPQVRTMPESHPFLQHPPVPAMLEPHPFLQQSLTSAMAESDFDFNGSGLPNYHVDNGACASESLNPLRINYEYMEPDLQPVVPPSSTMLSNSDNTMNLDSMVSMASNDLFTSDIDASVFDSRSTINMVNRECTGFIRNSLDLPRELCHLSSSVLNNNMAETGGLGAPESNTISQILSRALNNIPELNFPGFRASGSNTDSQIIPQAPQHTSEFDYLELGTTGVDTDPHFLQSDPALEYPDPRPMRLCDNSPPMQLDTLDSTSDPEWSDLANNDDDGFESLFEALEELLDEGEGPIPTPSTP